MNVIIQKMIVIKQSFRVRNMMYWMMMVICIINSVLFVYRLLIDIHNVVSLWQLGVPLEMALYSGIIATMIETDDDRHLNKGLASLILLTVFNALLIVYKSAQPH
jgi:hypothetical protein